MTHFAISLAPVDGAPADLHLSDDGQLATVSDAHAVGQHVRQRLKTFSGEWFLDAEAGVPWLDDILGRGYDAALAEAIIKAEILQTHGVEEITSFSVSFDDERRELRAASITVLTIYDTEIGIAI